MSDNAGGMPEKIIKAIKEGKRATTHGKGRGCGMQITRRTLEEHGGFFDITLRTDEIAGSVFNIYIPIR